MSSSSLSEALALIINLKGGDFINKKYVVKDCVCDYSVCLGDEIILILNSRLNAFIICGILNCDSEHRVCDFLLSHIWG
jgi:hypothetical protein